MTNLEIQKKIDRNRELINRALHTDLDPVVLSGMVTKLSDNNLELIQQLND